MNMKYKRRTIQDKVANVSRILFLLADTDSATTSAGSLGMLTTDPDTPVVTQTTVGSNLLKAFQIFTELVVQEVRHNLVRLAVLVIALSVEEPIRNLVLTGVLHDGDDLFDFFFGDLTSALVHVNIGFFQNHVGVTATHTLDGSESEHDAPLTIDVGVKSTKNVLEVLGDD